MSITCEIKNYKTLKKQMEDVKNAPRKVIQAVTGEATKRAPVWIASEVSKVYGIKKGEITGKKVRTVTVQGNSIEQVKVIYTGRPLTHTHFGMTPNEPKPDGGAYTLKATIIKGERKALGKVKKFTKKQRAALGRNFTRSAPRTSDHSPIMLMRANGGHYLPFQRVSQNRKDIVVRKAISLPQMVSSKRTEEGIQTALSEGLGKRLNHHLQRYMGK